MEDMYTISGTVVTGDHLGEILGFPTANLDAEKLGKVLKDIPRGVYAGTVKRTSNDTTHKAGIVIGAQDTHKPPKVEAHLIDFTGNLYGEEVVFNIKKYIREIRDYNDENDLKHDIQEDIDQIKKALKQAKEEDAKE